MIFLLITKIIATAFFKKKSFDSPMKIIITIKVMLSLETFEAVEIPFLNELLRPNHDVNICWWLANEKLPSFHLKILIVFYLNQQKCPL